MSHDDQRMKELANRLVAMSPEPPPFPEEEVTLTTRTTPTRLRPLMAFVGAALLVLIGAAIPLMLMNGNGEPPIGTTTPPVTEPPQVETTEPTETTTPTTVTTQPTETTEPSGSVTTFQTAVFLVQSPENSLNGNPALVPFWTEVEVPEGSSVELARLALLANDDLTMPSPEFYNVIPEDIEILGVAREDSTLVVEVNEAFRAGASGLLADMTMLNQLVYAATYLNDADLVLFVIDGRPIVDFGDGLDISDGVSRETFLDSMSLVLVTHPVYVGDGLPQVEGIANVFEATVSLEILDSAGEVVYSDFTTATCGTGCWGEYVFSLDTPALTPGSVIRVFWDSPEDGSRRDVVYIPYAEEAVWELTPGE